MSSRELLRIALLTVIVILDALTLTTESAYKVSYASSVSTIRPPVAISSDSVATVDCSPSGWSVCWSRMRHSSGSIGVTAGKSVLVCSKVLFAILFSLVLVYYGHCDTIAPVGYYYIAVLKYQRVINHVSRVYYTVNIQRNVLACSVVLY